MVTDHPDYSEQELVAFCRNIDADLTAIIALHDTGAGPAMGGCRMARYPAIDDALTDVLRLSKGMSYKNLMAGQPYGGGKAVIVADPRTEKTPALLAAFAEELERFGGTFYSGEDVGTTVADIEAMRRVARQVRGILADGPGDPSPMTARGVFGGIEAAVRHRRGASDLESARVIVQGLGAVGMQLAELVREVGATLIVSDIDARRAEEALARLGATAVPPETCHAAEAEVYAPCALGGALGERTIANFRAQVVAGAANNQLSTPEDGRRPVMLDTMVAYLWPEASSSLSFVGNEVDPARGQMGLDLVSKTMDRYIAVGSVPDKEQQGLCRSMDRPDLITDERFATVAARSRNVVERRALMSAEVAKWPSAEILSHPRSEEVPRAPILSRTEVLNAEQVLLNGVVEVHEDPALGPVRQPRPAARLSETPAVVRQLAPYLGADNAEIMDELGYPAAEIQRLTLVGVLCANPLSAVT